MTKRKNFGVLLIVGCVALAWPLASFAETLPVFELLAPQVKQARAQATAILTDMSGGMLPEKAQVTERGNAIVHRAGSNEVEIQKASGGIFARDTEQLWNRKLKPTLPSQAQARQIADQFLARNRLLPQGNAWVQADFAGYGDSGVIFMTETGQEKIILNQQVNYDVGITIAGQRLPVVGGGGNFKVFVGDGGAVIGYHGVWRPLRRVVAHEEILPQEEAEAQFREQMGELNLTRVESLLAYYSASSLEGQTYVAPVWVVMAEAEIDGNPVPLRNTIVAATDYGPQPPHQNPTGTRTLDDLPLSSLYDDEGSGVPWKDDGENPPEAGAEWIGPSQGLWGSEANAQGFLDSLGAAGWNNSFDWGEEWCWESDFVRNDDIWVDAVDWVFYTGHASKEGWVANEPDDDFVDHEELGGGGFGDGRYGSNDLEWLTIAACGPHQDDALNGGGNVFARWRGILDGLHVHMGYAAVTYDNTVEGGMVADLALAGNSVINAWLDTCVAVQPSTNGYPAPNGPNIYGTALYQCNAGDDHIWGAGTTVADEPAPSCRAFTWTQC